MLEQFSNLPKLPTLAAFRDMSPMRRREMWIALLFLAPWIIGFLAFTLLPTIATLVFSFMNLKLSNIAAGATFVGVDNYVQFGKDAKAWGSMLITLRYALIALPVGILLPLGLALLMNSKYLLGKNAFRSMFYMPYIIPFVAAVFLWGGMLNPENGWINRALLGMGVPKASLPLWVNDASTVYPAYVIIGLWGVGQAMLIMLAGLQGVPTELYDASNMDGANGWQQFLYVTFPMISPVIFFNLVLNIVGLSQYFLVPLVVNTGSGAPGGATYFYNLYLYHTFFRDQNFAYGATLAWVLFIIVLVITLVLFSTAKYWVYYAGDGRS